MPNLHVTRMILEHTGLATRDAHKLRGDLGRRFAGHPLLHNHLGPDGFRYRYPLVQYKIRGGRAVILGIEAGGEDLRALFLDLDRLYIGDRELVLREKLIQQHVEDFGWIPEPRRYRFETPWLGLNQRNFAAWQRSGPAERVELLERVLTGNLLSLAKGLDYRLAPDQRIEVRTRFEPQTVQFKNQPMVAFRGTFSANFIVPDWFGLGKSCARGFGAVRPAAEPDTGHPQRRT